MSKLISRSAYQVGFGTDKFKSVQGLTPDERAQAFAGKQVFFRSARLSRGKTGTAWRVALAYPSGCIYPRVPSADDVAALRAATGLN